MPVESPLLYYQQIQSPEKLPDRTFGVQVLILDADRRIWVQRDPDGGRVEAHARIGETVTFPNTLRARFNAVSGGIRQGETPQETAYREMRKELKSDSLGAGATRLRTDLPLFMCCQEKEGHAYLFAAAILEYYPTPPETAWLNTIGRFWTRDTLMRRLNSGTQEELFRPAFALGVALIDSSLSQADIEQRVGEYNQKVLAATLTRTWDGDTRLHYPKIFTDLVLQEASF